MSTPKNTPSVSVLGTLRAVLWGFLGLRRQSGFQQDINQLKPLPLMLTAVVLGFLFVVTLMGLVFWIAG